MTAHLHSEFMPGCYRCNLSLDETDDRRAVCHWCRETVVVDDHDFGACCRENAESAG